MLFFYFDGFLIIDNYSRSLFDSELLISLSFFGIIYFGNELLNIPFSIYNTFIIEEKFGFNKTTKKIYIIDVGFKFEKITDKSSSFQVVQNAVFCLQKQTVPKITSKMVYIEPSLDNFTFYEYSLSKRKKMLELGRLAAMRALRK